MVAELQHEAVKTSQAGIVDKDYLAMKHQLKKYKVRNNEFKEVGKCKHVFWQLICREANRSEKGKHDLTWKT